MDTARSIPWRWLQFAKTVALFGALAFICLLIGAAVPLLPVQLTVMGVVMLMMPLFVVIVWGIQIIWGN